MVVEGEVLKDFSRFFGILIAEFVAGGVVNRVLKMKGDMIIKDLNLNPTIDAMMREFLKELDGIPVAFMASLKSLRVRIGFSSPMVVDDNWERMDASYALHFVLFRHIYGFVGIFFVVLYSYSLILPTLFLDLYIYRLTFVWQMVNTRQSTPEFSGPTFNEAVQRAVNALLPGLTAQITNELRQNDAGGNGD
nr:hypothetical protein [Tanacetum cinerariifolium]